MSYLEPLLYRVVGPGPAGLPAQVSTPTYLEHLTHQVIGTVVFSLLGLVIFVLLFQILTWAAPFSIRKEIEEDQNVALGIILGAAILAIGLIIAAAIHG